MVKPGRNIEIIAATAEELRAYAANKAVAPDFCEYLKKQHKLHAKEVMADFSGLTFSNINLSDIDLGNIVVGRHKVGDPPQLHTTDFQNCTLQNTKFRSNASMDGLRFTHCTNMKGASFVGDIGGVEFGVDSNMSEVNLKEAYNIDQCIINPGCTVSEVKLGYPDRETFDRSMSDKVQIQETATEHVRANAVPNAPDVERIVAPPQNLGVTIGFLPAIVGAGRVLRDGFNAAVGLVGSLGSGVATAATATVVVGADRPADPVELHKGSVEKIKASNPEFSNTMRNITLSDRAQLTKEVVVEWAVDNNGAEKSDRMTLSEFVRIRDDIEGIPHLENLDLKGMDFSGLEFGNVIMSRCNFSGATFHQSDLDKLSARDCNFTGAKITETFARNADFTRSVFHGAKIDKTSFDGTTLVDAKLSSKDSPARITSTTFRYSDMRSAQLDSAEFQHVILDHTNMQEVRGDGVMLFKVTAESANLSRAELTDLAARDTTLEGAIAHDANLAGAMLDHVRFTNVDAQGINLDGSNHENVTMQGVDFSYGTMNNAKVKDLTIENAHLVKFQAQSLKAESLKLSDTNAQGADLSGAHIDKSSMTKVNLSHAKMQNVAIKDSVVTSNNFHATNLSGDGAQTRFINTDIKGNNLTDANISNTKIEGATFHSNDLRGANISSAVIGTDDAKTDVKDNAADIATNWAHTASHAVDPNATITVDSFDGGTDKGKIADLAQRSEDQQALTANTLTNTIVSAGATVRDAAASVAVAAGAVADEIRIHKKSRLGMVVGIAVGVVVGVGIGAFAASTFGLGLIPAAIAAGVAISAGTVGGGLIGNAVQNTNTGRGLLAVGVSVASTMIIGPMGAMALPIVAAYNVITGKKTPFKSAAGAVMDSFVVKPMKFISSTINSIFPTKDEQVDAQRAKQMKDARDAVVAEEARGVDAMAVDKHQQNTIVAEKVTGNMQKASAVEKEVQKSHEVVATPAHKKGWVAKVGQKVSHVAHKVKDKITPKKRADSHAAQVAAGAATAPAQGVARGGAV